MAHLALLAALFTLPLLIVYHRSKRRVRYPPGPPGLPIVGNVRDIPTPQDYPWLKYHDWSRKYNTDVLRLNAMGTNIIVLNTLEVTTELLDKRSSVYSDRPRMVLLNELAGFGWNFGAMDYGEDWRVCRKMTYQDFNASAFPKYRPILEQHAHGLLRRLANDRGARLTDHLKHMVGANIMEVTYGIKVLPEHDPFIELAEKAQECVATCATGGVYLVDILPFLKHVPAWFPGAKFQRDARIWHKAADDQLHVAYGDFVQRASSGAADDCMAKTLTEIYGTDEGTVRRMEMATATMYMAGVDSTATLLHWFFLAMVLYPDVQARARRELEEVLGSCRLPTFDDYGSIPYIDALVKETLRWHPIVPLVFPRKLRSDDVYNGCLIEKNSIVLVNMWSIMHDEKVYPDLSAFNPDRFLKDGVLNADVLDPELVGFGFGRRTCPGKTMAYETTWITIASVLMCLEIGKAKDDRGKEIAVEDECVSGFISTPKPFVCDVRYRSEAHAALLGGP